MDWDYSFGVAPDSLGVILQRGGEELRLAKVGDRFTLCLENPPPDWPALIPGESRGMVGRELYLFTTSTGNLDVAMDTARSLPFVRFASHVYALADSSSSYLYLGSSLTVQFEATTPPERRDAIAQQFHLSQPRPLQEDVFVYTVAKTAPENPLKLANRLMDLAEVLTAEPDVLIRPANHYRPADPLYPQQWYLQHNGGPQLQGGSHINIETAWDITRGDPSIVIAIADDGVDLDHPDFQGIGKVVAPRNFQKPDQLPLPSHGDDNHGTACAGVALAAENGKGIVGVAPGCALMPLKTTGYLDDQSIEDLFNWAIDQGADVISCSWGAAAVYFPLSLRQRAAITKAATQGRQGKGCVVVFAAGNSNRPTDGTVNEQGWPNNLLIGETNWLSGFAVHPDVIAVAATTSLSKKAFYSNWGRNISISAPSSNALPGVYLESQGYVFTAPAIKQAAAGLGVFTSDRLGAAGYSSTDFTDTFGGTSSACPIVAGVAALVLSVNPELSAQEVRQILQYTADKITDPDPDPQLGTNYSSYDTRGHSLWFGYGKVNAAKAVQAALVKKQPAPQAILTGSNPTAFTIPDAQPQGVVSHIRITESGRLQTIAVTINIIHQFLGDLEIYLQPPGGQRLLLQGRTLGNQQQLTATYSLATTPVLGKLINQQVGGVWQLRVIDRVPMDTGTLQNWLLQLGI